MTSDISERVYIPSAENKGIPQEEYLKGYIAREFPQNDLNRVYSIPRKFTVRPEKQASKAELTIFSRLHGLAEGNLCKDTWVVFFHGTSYAGRSHRNQRIGKLMVREHDFVIFTKYKDKHFIALAEVKSTHDAATNYADIDVISDARVVKNNKRSAQHQLRDHTEVLDHLLGTTDQIQCFIMWPFLSSLTRDPKQLVIKRWKEDGRLHVFEDCLHEQESFDRWFMNDVIGGKECNDQYFHTLLNRYIILSCGVFVDEIYQGMLALLTQNQMALLNSRCGGPGTWGDGSTGAKVIHGAAGTGKTLLVVKKLQQLYERGELNENNRALYICYWPGIKRDFENKIQKLNLHKYVDSARFYISQTGFLFRNKYKYKHIFMDEAEVICIAFENVIMMKTISEIYQRYHNGNCDIQNCTASTSNYKVTENCAQIFQNHNLQNWGELWFLVDINQASLFLPKHSPNILKTPNIVLNQVMRSTGYIFDVFKQFYMNPIPKVPSAVTSKMNLDDINIGHNLNGPPIFWVNPLELCSENKTLDTLVRVIIDLCSTKGIKPNNLCIIPFMASENFSPDVINNEITKHFVENGYKPNAVGDVEDFVTNSQLNDFLVAWALRVKGLEFKVVIIVMDEEDFDMNDDEDRKKMYIIASRCTCLLIVICPEETKKAIDKNDVIKNYSFNLVL